MYVKGKIIIIYFFQKFTKGKLNYEKVADIDKEICFTSPILSVIFLNDVTVHQTVNLTIFLIFFY